MITWVAYLGIGLVIGIASGIYLSRLDMLKSKKQQQLEEDLERTRTELDSYRTEVARHFVQTSSLINNMTESYRAVFDHLSSGARELCGDRLATHLLDLPKTRMLEQEEQARAAEDVSASAAAISDIENAPQQQAAAGEAAAEADSAAQTATTDDEAGTETPAQETAAAEARPEPEQTAKAEPAPKVKQHKKKKTAERPTGSNSPADDDEHAAFAGEQGIPAEVAAAVGSTEEPAASEEPQQPTVH